MKNLQELEYVLPGIAVSHSALQHPSSNRLLTSLKCLTFDGLDDVDPESNRGESMLLQLPDCAPNLNILRLKGYWRLHRQSEIVSAIAKKKSLKTIVIIHEDEHTSSRDMKSEGGVEYHRFKRLPSPFQQAALECACWDELREFDFEVRLLHQQMAKLMYSESSYLVVRNSDVSPVSLPHLSLSSDTYLLVSFLHLTTPVISPLHSSIICAISRPSTQSSSCITLNLRPASTIPIPRRSTYLFLQKSGKKVDIEVQS